MKRSAKWIRIRTFAVACLAVFFSLRLMSHATVTGGLSHPEINEIMLDESSISSSDHRSPHSFFGEEEQLLEEQINFSLPSMTVILVKDGKTLVSVTRGLHQGQLNEGVGRFDVGSLSRFTTSLALLDLMTKNGIRLEDAIGSYLPDTLQKHRNGIFNNIRFVDLFTHATGFVNHRFGTASYSAFATSTKERAMKHVLSRGTQQLFSPGKVSMYSNVSHALAGILIGELSGSSFETYLKRYLATLGMSSSYIVEDWKNESVGKRYYVDGGNVTPAPDYYALLPSADSLMTTPDDMTELLKKLTNSEFPREFRLFDPVFSNSRFTSRSTAFNIVEYKGKRIYMLDGSLPGAFSRIAMVPEWNTAFFIYYNSDSVEAREVLTQTLMAGLERQLQQDRNAEYGKERTTGNTTELSREDKSWVRRLSGDYKTLNYSLATPESISAFAHQLRINAVDGGLMIDRTFYRPVPEQSGELDTFYSEKAEEYIEFKTDDRNRFTYVVIGNEFYTGAFSSTVQITILLLFGLVLFFLLLRILRKWHMLHTGRVDDRPRVLVFFYCILMLGVLALAALAVRECTYWGIAYGGGWALATLRIVGWITPLALGVMVWSALSTRGDYKWRGTTSVLMYLAIPLNLYLFLWLFHYRLIALF